MMCSMQNLSIRLVFTLFIFFRAASSLATPTPTSRRAIVVTGGNKGQGYALCQRILAEHDDTYLFLCARDASRGEQAAAQLSADYQNRVEVVKLDVTVQESVVAAADQVKERLAERSDLRLHGVVSNAGILWGYSLAEHIAVNAVGVCRVMDIFLPLLDPENGRFIVVSSGLGPLMHGFASEERQEALKSDTLTLDSLSQMMEECLQVERNKGGSQDFEAIGFPGGPFAETVPDFHMYGLAKMFADAYMLRMSRKNPSLRINSCDPGLVYTDLILKMPKYDGMSREESGAKTPAEGVEAAMRLLFGKDGQVEESSGCFYAMSKDRNHLMRSTIDVMPKG